jgi:hypothetical protein
MSDDLQRVSQIMNCTWIQAIIDGTGGAVNIM